jgi:hypothetical protein
VKIIAEQRLRVFENKGLRRIFGPNREEVGEAEAEHIIRGFIICTLHQILSG